MITVDQRKFNRQLSELLHTVPQSADKIVRNEARLLTAEVIKGSLPKRGIKATKEAIEKSIHRVYKPSNRGGARQISVDEYKRLKRQRHAKSRWVRQQILSKFIREQKKHAGFLAAGWLGQDNPLNVTVPAAIRQHNKVGTVTVYKTPKAIRIMVVNKVKYAAAVKHMIQNLQRALSVRAVKMRANLKRIMSGKAKYRV